MLLAEGQYLRRIATLGTFECRFKRCRIAEVLGRAHYDTLDKCVVEAERCTVGAIMCQYLAWSLMSRSIA